MTIRAFSLLFGLLGLSSAAMPAAEPAQPATPAPLEAPAQVLTQVELDKLVGPIALHPDALVALILPAATAPSDIVLAVRQLARGLSVEAMENEPWDDSVKALVRYPEMLRWLDENLAWTKRLGEAFAVQPADVMNAIQRLRAKARVAGTLRDNNQQSVVVEEEEIRIVPTRTEVIYIPRYNPAVVYVDRPVYAPHAFVTFGIGYAAGHWLAYDCDWRRRTVCYVPRHHRTHVWRERHDWRHRIYHVNGRDHRRDDRWHAWRPSPHRHRDRENHYTRGYNRPMPNPVNVPQVRRWPDPVNVPSLNHVSGDRPTSAWRQRERRDGNRFQQREQTPRHWERPGRTHGDRSPGDRIQVRTWDRPVNLPSGPSVRPVTAVRAGSEIMRPAARIVRPQPTPSVVRPQATVRPQPSVRSQTTSRLQTVRAPNGRVLPNRDGGRVSGRGERTRAPNGRWVPAR